MDPRLALPVWPAGWLAGWLADCSCLPLLLLLPPFGGMGSRRSRGVSAPSFVFITLDQLPLLYKEGTLTRPTSPSSPFSVLSSSHAGTRQYVDNFLVRFLGQSEDR